MEKIEFYQRSAVIENYRKLFLSTSKISKIFLSKIFLSTFFQILAMNVIKYFDLIVCFEKRIDF